jgi:DNA (cytosine-5)-methyltransferase 1
MCRVISELKPAWVLGENVPGIINLALDKVISDLEDLGYSCQAFNIPACAVDAPHRRARIFIVAHAECSERWPSIAGGNEQNGDFARRTEKAGWIGASGQNGGEESLADSNGIRRGQARREFEQFNEKVRERQAISASASGKNLADSDSKRLSKRNELGDGKKASRGIDSRRKLERTFAKGGRFEWSTESGLGGMVDGISSWLDEPGIPRVANGIKNRVDRLKCLGNAVVPQQVYPILKAIADIERNIGFRPLVKVGGKWLENPVERVIK